MVAPELTFNAYDKITATQHARCRNKAELSHTISTTEHRNMLISHIYHISVDYRHYIEHEHEFIRYRSQEAKYIHG